MASPHVAGAAALYLQANHNASPATVAGALTAKATVNLVGDVMGSPNLLLYVAGIAPVTDVTPPTVSLTAPAAGATLINTVTVSASATDNAGIAFVQFFLDGGLVATDNSSPYSFSWDTTDGANGVHRLVATAVDSSGNQRIGLARDVTVANPGRALFDEGFGVPTCGTPSAICDSGVLLGGRGTVGPEPNNPNTLDGCSDGISGSFGLDESLNRLKIFTTDGTPLAAGKQVTIETTLFAYSVTEDTLEIYATANAASPSWTRLTSLQPAGIGSQIVRVNYTLPAGSWQAIRGVFRYGGAGGTCPGGAYDDVDDLVFATAAQPSAAITSPASGATVSGSVTISANASTGVTKVVFYAGSAVVGTDTSSPFSLAWNTTTVADGTYALTARAYDAAGNSGSSASVSVTVDNAPASTPSDLIVSGGFEPAVTGWTKTGAAYFSTGGVEHAGVGYGYIGKANGVTGALAQQITIPAGRTATLSFWLNISSDEPATAAAVDQLFVEVLNTSGVKLATLATYSNRDEAANGAYHLESGFSLTPFAGQTIRLQFRGTTDAANMTAFRFDDVSVRPDPANDPPLSELLSSGGFEPAVTGWTKTGAGFFSTGGVQHTGVGYGYLCKANGVSGTLSQQIAIPAGTNPTLSFWLNVTSDEVSATTAADQMFVEVVSASGATLATLTTYSNLDKGPNGVYSLQNGFSLGAFAGTTVGLRFRAVTDAQRQTAFRLDDVSVK
jgi:hypothetical protein